MFVSKRLFRGSTCSEIRYLYHVSGSRQYTDSGWSVGVVAPDAPAGLLKTFWGFSGS